MEKLGIIRKNQEKLGKFGMIFHYFFLKAENVANALMYLNQLDQLYSNQIRPR